MIAVIQTGGTIAGAAEAGKIHPHAGDALGELIEASARQMNLAVMQEPLRAPSGKKLAARDSCDLGSADWLALQTQLHALAVGCSAIVVLHGTDTMAYTASALPEACWQPGCIPACPYSMRAGVNPSGSARISWSLSAHGSI